MQQKISGWVQKYEKHLSAFAVVAGFIADTVFFERIDLWQTQIVFAAYTAICFITIPLHHWMESHEKASSRWRSIVPLITQFTFGGFWSGFVVFYGRSADVSVSWPFLLILLLVFLGNEYFYRSHEQIVFTSVLFFFALYSYAIFAVPIYTKTLGTGTFLLSGLMAIGVFALFTALLRVLGRERFLADVWRIRAGALGVFIVFTASYFTNILPPLPLSSGPAGVYHSVSRVPGAYMARSEPDPWRVRYLGFTPTRHVVPGGSLFAYSSVFAPTKLTTTIVHRWQWYDSVEKEWVTKSVIAYQIVGGRDGGYRGYSTVPIRQSGKWRVVVETVDGRRIARLPFIVEIVAVEPPQKVIVLP
ncbi:MAG: DUF2914 domain-containing protein [Candidatus Paceibacterota bacterium]|jgi:hypothetical protein